MIISFFGFMRSRFVELYVNLKLIKRGRLIRFLRHPPDGKEYNCGLNNWDNWEQEM